MVRNRRNYEDGHHRSGIFSLCTLNIVKGFTGCDRKLLEVGTMFGYNGTPEIFLHHAALCHGRHSCGMRIGLGYSWRAIIGAEMVAASTGLGQYGSLFAQQMSRTDKVIVGIFAIGIAGYLTGPDLRSSHQHLSERSR